MTTLETAQAAVEERPEDDAAWQVYADALLAAGDPRGELIALERKLKSGDDDATRAQAAALREKHFEQWVAPGLLELTRSAKLAGRVSGAPLRIDWEHGYPAAITLTGLSYSGNTVEYPGHAHAWRALSAMPANLRFVHFVRFGSTSASDDEPDWSDAVEALTACAPPRLRTLRLDRGDYWDISSTSVSGLEGTLWRAVPRLEELFIELGQVSMGELDLPALRRFEIKSGGLDEGVVHEVARAKWPKLERLVFWLGVEEYGGFEDPAAVGELLATEPPPALKHLGLCNAMFSDALPALLLRSRWLPQLDVLDLSCGTFGAEGAQVLLDNVDAFKHAHLELGRSYLEPAMAEKLRAAFPRVSTLHQRGGSKERRYVTLSE